MQNRNPMRRGFSRNGAPAGYGQQRGHSPFLDSPDQQEGQEERGMRTPMSYERNAPAAPEQPDQQEMMQQALLGQQQTAAGAPGGMQRPQVVPIQGGYSASPADVWGAMGGNQAGSQYGGSPEGPSQTPYGQPAAAQRTTIGDPTRGAFAQYGDGNIEGAQGMRTGDYMGQLEGFNTGAWGSDERGSNSIKNTFGKIASRYDVSQPGAVRQLMQDPDFQNFFPGAKLVEHPNADLIDFGDGNGPVDVIRGAVAGGSGAGWQWGANPIGGGPSQGAPIGGAPSFPPIPGAPGADQLHQQLMAALQGGGMQDSGGISIEQLMAALGLNQPQF